MSDKYDSMLNKNILRNDTKRGHGRRSQWRFFKVFFPLYAKLRFGQIWGAVILAIVTLITLFIYLFPKPGLTFDIKYREPKIESYTIFKGLYWISTIKGELMSQCINVYPMNRVTEIINESFYEPERSRPWTFYRLFNDTDEFNNQIKTNLTGNNYYNVSKAESEYTVEYYFTNDFTIPYFKESIYKGFLIVLGKIKNITINYGNWYLPSYTIVGYSIFTSLFFNIAPTLIFLLAFTTIINFQETKVFLLLTISGAREYTIWSAFITPDVIYTILYSLLISLLIYPAKCFGKHNFILFFSIILFPMLAIYTMMLTFVPLIRQSSHYKWYVIFFIIIGIVLGFVVMVNEIVPYVPDDLFYILSYFLPQLNLLVSFSNLMKLDAFDRVLSLSTMSYGNYLTSNQIIVSSIVSILIYATIFLLFQLLLPRAAGSPPIGIRNIFSFQHWKKLFSSPKSYECMDPEVPFVTVEGISKTYSSSAGKVHALVDCSFSIGQNEIIVLIGPNGCGKSTLLNSMTGAIESDNGNLYLYGQKAELGFSEMQNCIGITFQFNVLIDKLSVIDHLRFFGRIRGASDEQIKTDIQHLASSLDLTEILPMNASTLSGGQKRKLCIAIAFIGSPPCVILDEPTAGIDVTTRQTIWKAISHFKNTSCLVTSHSLEEAESVASRLFVMKSGKIIFQGTSSQLRQEYHCGYRLSTIGNADMMSLLSFCNSIVAGSTIDDERKDTILIPISDSVANLFTQLDSKKEQFGIQDFTVTVEQLEHVILRIFVHGD